MIHRMGQPPPPPTVAPGRVAGGCRVLLAVANPEGRAAAGPLARLLGGGPSGGVVLFHEENPGSPETIARHILQAAAGTGAHLVAVTTHQRQGMRRLLLGSVAEAVVRAADRPVLCVPVGWNGPGVIRRILAPVDRRAGTERAVSWTLSIAHGFGAEAEFLEVVPRLCDGVLSRSGVAATVDQQLLADARRDLRAWAAELAGDDLRFLTTVVPGNPVDEILARTQETGADIVILASRAGNGPREAPFIGSVTERVLRRSPCPVLAVRA